MNNFINIEEQKQKIEQKKSILFSYGFRPFFLSAALYAIIATLPWFAVVFEENSIFYSILKTSDFPSIWHAHEMLYGFVAAAIAGFLLTAIPNWTGCKAVSGIPLILLFSIWLIGRISFWTIEFIPSFYHFDLLFFPTLLLMIASALIKAKKLRNLVFLVIIFALFLCNIVVHYGLSTNNYETAKLGILLTIYCISIIITIIGGRIIPNFSRTALRNDKRTENIKSFKWLDISSILSIFIIIIIEIADNSNNSLLGIMSIIVSALHISRIFFWQGWKAYYSPILWILHIGYLFLPIGFLLKGLGEFAIIDNSLYIHSLTVGMMGIMIVAVMSRASLGHTGRKMNISKITLIAYLFIICAVIFRAVLPIGDFIDYNISIKISAVFWIGGFILYNIIYVPILVSPRADGKQDR